MKRMNFEEINFPLKMKRLEQELAESKVGATRSTTADNLKPLSGISKSQMWVFVFSKFR